MTKPMKRKQPTTGPKTAATLIKRGIEQMMGNPELRKKLGITLFDLDEAAKERRRLLRLSNQGKKS